MKKTTLMIEEDIYRQVRLKAVLENRSVSSVVAEALALYMADQAAKSAPRRPMPTAKGAKWFLPPDIDPASNRQIFDYLETLNPTESKP